MSAQVTSSAGLDLEQMISQLDVAQCQAMRHLIPPCIARMRERRLDCKECGNMVMFKGMR